MLHQSVLSGTATADGVARVVGIGERSLRRRLAEEGVRLQQLINLTRRATARQLPQNTRLPIAEIAAALHDAKTNTFARAFRQSAACSPSQRRAAASTAVPG